MKKFIFLVGILVSIQTSFAGVILKCEINKLGKYQEDTMEEFLEKQRAGVECLEKIHVVSDIYGGPATCAAHSCTGYVQDQKLTVYNSDAEDAKKRKAKLEQLKASGDYHEFDEDLFLDGSVFYVDEVIETEFIVQGRTGRRIIVEGARRNNPWNHNFELHEVPEFSTNSRSTHLYFASTAGKLIDKKMSCNYICK